MKEMKLLKDINIDKDACLKYVDTQTKDAIWKPIMKASTEECFSELSTKRDEISKELEEAPFNIKKDQCNVMPMAFLTCVHLTSFAVYIR